MIDHAIYSKTSGNAGITALISTRLYRDRAPNNIEFPFVVMIKGPNNPDHNLAGPNGLADTSFTFLIFAESRATTLTISEAIRNCWDGYRGTVSSIVIRRTELESEEPDVLDRDGMEAPVFTIEQVYKFVYELTAATLST